MTEQKIKKYTLIDNFDKVNLEKYSDFLKTPRKEVLFGSPSTPLYNYKYMSSPDSFYFMPDMFRFLTGRRFNIALPTTSGKSQTILAPPPKETAFDSTFGCTSLQEIPVYGPDFLFDVDNIENIVNKNFEALGSAVKFESYFKSKPSSGATNFFLDGMVNEKVDLEGFRERLLDIQFLTFSTALNTGAKIKLYHPSLDWWFLVTMSTLNFFPTANQLIAGGLWTDIAKLLASPPPEVNPFAGDEAVQYLHGLGPGDPAGIIQQLMFVPRMAVPPFQTIAPSKHLYFVSDHEIATSISEKTNADEHMINNVVEVSAQYNYLNPTAELSYDLEKADLYELHLPNMYVYNAYTSATPDAPSMEQYYKELITLDKDINFDKKDFTPETYVAVSREHDAPLPPVIAFGPKWDAAVPLEVADLPAGYRHRNIVFANRESLSAAEKYKGDFPFGVDVNLGPKSPSNFMKTLETKSKNAMNAFMSLLSNYSLNYNLGKHEQTAHRFFCFRDYAKFVMPSLEGLSLGEKFAMAILATLGETAEKLSMLDLQFLDLDLLFTDWAGNSNKFYDYFGRYIKDSKSVKLADSVWSSDPSTCVMELFLQMNKEISGIAKEYFNSKALYMEDIYTGKKCHTEVIAYEIAKFKNEKHSSGNRAADHIQSIFIPNIFPDESPVNYFDTQVIYGKEYVYEIFAHTLVVGASYKYETVETPELPDMKIELEKKELIYNFQPAMKPTNLQPRAIIVRAPYYNNQSLLPMGAAQKVTMVTSRPPLPPDLAFYPYKDSESKVLMLLNQNHGRRLMIPNTSLFPEDLPIIEGYKVAQQDEGNPPGYITYGADDIGGMYEIYRINERPTSWSDFVNSPTLAHVVLDSTAQSGMNDTISKNTDYYYFARMRDVHGNISNPTNVFKVRIVQESGFPPYLIMKAHYFPKMKDLIVTELPFKKFLKVRFNDLGTVEGNSAKTANVSYAPKKGDVIKKYKIRVTSKKTGKKIDVNIEMKNKIIDKFATPQEAAEEANAPGVPVIEGD